MADNEIIREIVDQVGRSTKKWGLSPLIGQAWMLLYFKGEKTQDELRDELKCSPGSISQALGVLESFGMVYVSSKKGRKKAYMAEDSFSKVKRNKMETIITFYIEPMTNLLSNRADIADSKETRNKIKELKNMYSKIGNILKLILRLPSGK